jgi:hypothetical protein
LGGEEREKQLGNIERDRVGSLIQINIDSNILIEPSNIREDTVERLEHMHSHRNLKF